MHRWHGGQQNRHDTSLPRHAEGGEGAEGGKGGRRGGNDQAPALPGQGEQWGWAGLGWAGLGWGATSHVTLARPASVQPLLESPSGCSLADAPAGGSDGDFSAAPGRRRTRATGHSTAIGRIADLRGWNGGGKGGIPARATRSLALVRARAGRDETGCMQSRPPLPQHYGMRRRHGHSGVERSTEVKLCRQSWWAGGGEGDSRKYAGGVDDDGHSRCKRRRWLEGGGGGGGGGGGDLGWAWGCEAGGRGGSECRSRVHTGRERHRAGLGCAAVGSRCEGRCGR